ncbi:unnamed protein product [Sphagnum tenellum]
MLAGRKAAIEAGDKQCALRFLSVAKRLYPNPQVDTLISSSYEERGGKQQAADNRQRHGNRWWSWYDDVRKAYRKLSLKVHPDKNKAPCAEEAFKAVSKAFQVLRNGELREDYDRYGPEEESQGSQHMRQWQHEE